MPISTLVIQVMNFTDYYQNKQLVQYVSSCLEMWYIYYPKLIITNAIWIT